jgi:hypothetical protein
VVRDVAHLPLFLRLRGGCFHENGFTFSAPGNFNNDVRFLCKDEDGKVLWMSEAVWNNQQRPETFVTLRPYADPAVARGCLTCMCAALKGTRRGSKDHRRVFAMAWIKMLTVGCGMPYEDDLIYHVWGKSRVDDVLAGYGTPESLLQIDLLDLLAEALSGPPPIGTEITLAVVKEKPSLTAI